jgi:hypothetical protein
MSPTTHDFTFDNAYGGAPPRTAQAVAARILLDALATIRQQDQDEPPADDPAA